MTRRASLSTPTERQAALNVGTVESVSPSRITVALELDAPQTTALNTGTPIAFPRLNSFVVVPNESGALVGIVVWLGVEHSNYPKRPGLKDFGLVDLPFPLRKMSVVPVGTLEWCTEPTRGAFRLRRGVVTFPSVGDPVALPSAEQLDALIRAEPEDRRVHIGRALLGNDANVCIDPDKLFGRHLAVLGNTGSGKSCTLAGLMRWSLEAATAERTSSQRNGSPNCRFIVLDPSGEYRAALKDLPGFRLFQVPPLETDGANVLRVPAWLLNSAEWASVTFASARVQRPILFHSLRHLRTGSTPEFAKEHALARIARSHVTLIQATKAVPSSYTVFPKYDGLGKSLLAFKEGLETYRDVDPGAEELETLIAEIESIVAHRCKDSKYWSAFSEPDLDRLLTALATLLGALPTTVEISVGNEDMPLMFDADLLADHLDMVASLGEFDEASRYIGGLKLRVRSLLSDERIRPILMPDEGPSLQEWLEGFLGDGSQSSVAVVDLSLVPSDVVEVVVAVMARTIFEALQRHRRMHHKALPTALVLEEAHTFVRAHNPSEDYPTAGEMCVRTFERIAREGRKFGLGLVLASQRPSELSPTILAQCNSFLLHRLVNDRDQQLVGKLVPDNLAGILEDLPSLPSRHALLLGWAAPLPTLLEIRELPPEQRPQSADPDFWDVWTGKRTPTVTWGQVADQWTGMGPAAPVETVQEGAGTAVSPAAEENPPL